ncbi:MAG TPA: AAA family ATPase [Niabella sp.]|nr:AAA family ATPase [Niabella sp.]
MKIQLKSLSLRNFKKVREFTINFTDRVTNIYGRNEAGKTTLFDAFLWLFFDKDSTDRKTFEIKTLDENNKAISKLEHEVAGVIDVDGQEIVLRKLYKEKWTKKRGETTPEFAGHDTSYYWNEVPCQKKEFEQKVSELFNEKIFKLITNTTYFNSLEWQDRRKVLIDMSGQISASDVLNRLNRNENVNTAELEKALSAKKSIEEFRREIGAKKKKIKDDLIMIPARIDEAKRQMPEHQDYDVIEYELQESVKDLDLIEDMISDKAKAKQESQSKILELMNKKQSLSKKMMEIEFSEKSKVQDRKLERESVLRDKLRLQKSIIDNRSALISDHTTIKKQIESLESDMASLREKWSVEDAKQLAFKDDEFCCPTCKRDYPESEINDKKVEMSKNFNTEKSSTLNKISTDGLAKKEEADQLRIKLSNIEADGAGLKDKIQNLGDEIAELEKQNDRLSADDENELAKAISDNKEYQQYKSDRDALAVQIEAPADEVEDNSALLQRKKELQIQIDGHKNRLSTKGQREKSLQRLSELEDQEGKWNQELADLEATEFTILSYEKAAMDLLEQRINGRFKLVKFKLFEQQINGGETPTCITLVNGVPYPDVNTAGKIQAGLDIINALSDHYNVYGPVWVDNRESVTSLPETQSQLINLIVSPEDKTLRVGSNIPVQETLFA